jgi:hypothetical protein
MKTPTRSWTTYEGFTCADGIGRMAWVTWQQTDLSERICIKAVVDYAVTEAAEFKKEEAR